MDSGKLTYVTGDALEPVINTGIRIIAHVCNDIGAWGAGFVLAISKKWIGPELAYRAATTKGRSLFLGQIQLIQIDDYTYVANMVGQHGIKRSAVGVPPIRYPALSENLKRVYEAISKGTLYFKAVELAEKEPVTIHMPRIGCGLAGGNWTIVENIIKEELVNKGIDVYVYNLPTKN